MIANILVDGSKDCGGNSNSSGGGEGVRRSGLVIAGSYTLHLGFNCKALEDFNGFVLRSGFQY